MPAITEAQYFGRNKVRYETQDLRVLQTEHFDIHHDTRDAATALLIGRMAERWRARLGAILQHELSGRQPIVLYGNPTAFAHTNVVSPLLDESVGGVTESGRRRIAMPLAATLADTDHVLGHELVHAYQFDMAQAHGVSRNTPLWFGEGLAEYLSVGSPDMLTRRVVLDAACTGKLPPIDKLHKARLSPYRVGHAVWAHLVERFGIGIVPQLLSARPKSDVYKRLAGIVKEDVASLSEAWHAEETARCEARESDAAQQVAEAGDDPGDADPRQDERRRGRLSIAPALSPDGRFLVYVTDGERGFVDLVLAEAETRTVVRRLLSRADTPDIESLQYVYSAASWSPDSARIVTAIIDGGMPVLVVFDAATGRATRRIPLPQFSQVVTPAWSPAGPTIAFSGVRSGVSDLHLLDLRTGSVQRLTDDLYADLQPAWSPDGARLAWATDRHSSDLEALDFGPLQVAIMDPVSRAVVNLQRATDAAGVSPQWLPDGRSVVAISDHAGVPQLVQLSADPAAPVPPVVVPRELPAGLTTASPMLSVARAGSRMAWSTLRRGRFEIRLGETPAALPGQPVPAALGDVEPVPVTEELSDSAPGTAVIDETLADARTGLADASTFRTAPYESRVGFNAMAQPYLAAGGSRFGSFIRGGASMFFGDMTGDRVAAVTVQAGSRLLDLGAEARWLDRRSRWHWGVTASFLPYVRLRSDGDTFFEGSERRLLRTSELSVQRQTTASVFLAWPLSRTQRVEVGAGVRHISLATERRSLLFGGSGKLLDDSRVDLPGGPGVLLGETRAAFVHDTSIFGGTGPVSGTRWRVEAATHVGTVGFSSLSADFRHYLMPVQPLTLAFRVAHAGRYGREAADSRLFPLYVGSRLPIRGYGSRTMTLRCAALADQGCLAGDDLFGERLVIANFEARLPVTRFVPALARLGIPMDAFAFAEGAFAWTARRGWDPDEAQRVRSLGLGVRANLMGMLLEVDVVRPLDRVRGGWIVTTLARPGF